MREFYQRIRARYLRKVSRSRVRPGVDERWFGAPRHVMAQRAPGSDVAAWRSIRAGAGPPRNQTQAFITATARTFR